VYAYINQNLNILILIEVGNVQTSTCSMVLYTILIEDIDYRLDVYLRVYIIFLVMRWKLGYINYLL